MDIFIKPDGAVQALYTDDFDFETLGKREISKASYIEVDEQSQFWSDLSPVDGPRLGPFYKRSQAIKAEQDWIVQNIFEVTNV